MTGIYSGIAPGIVLAAIFGLMNGTFTLPMRYLGRWAWKYVWALFIVVSCVTMPIAIALVTVGGLIQVTGEAPARAILVALVTGFVWGFGAIMVGQGMSAIGISMGNTLVLAISAALGPFLPMTSLLPACSAPASAASLRENGSFRRQQSAPGWLPAW